MKLSVIIPIYNAEKYLDRCIESVISQTYENIEIILVNDGSLDKSGEICDKYKKEDSRITVIHKENGGVSKARNCGMNIASGEYIFFLDSDDFIEKDALHNLSQRAFETEADIIMGNYKVINQLKKITLRPDFAKSSLTIDMQNNTTERFKLFFGKSYGIEATNKLYRVEFIKKLDVFFEDKINYGEDFLFNIKLFINNPKIEMVNEYTYSYYKNTDSITQTYKKELTERYLYLLTSFQNYAKNNNKLNECKDLIAFSSFTAIDNICLNSYQYSSKRFSTMRNELNKIKKSNIINSAISDLSKGKYLKEVPRRDWKYFARIFSILYCNDLTNLTVLLQILRFRIINKIR